MGVPIATLHDDEDDEEGRSHNQVGQKIVGL